MIRDRYTRPDGLVSPYHYFDQKHTRSVSSFSPKKYYARVLVLSPFCPFTCKLEIK